jgi:CDP-diacylglycerol---glycerol-3-phosphate 3-phosphatidyltransferase
MLSTLLKERARQLTAYLARFIAKSGITPNLLTIIGLLLNCVVAYILATGQLVVGGILVLVAGCFDMLDGALARVTNKSSNFGAFLDSTLDRYSEAVIFLGLLFYYASVPGSEIPTILIYASMVGSIMVSYTRARAEALGLKCEVGLLARPERIVVLAGGLLVNQLVIALWILAILANVTAVQRIVYIWTVSRRTSSDRSEAKDS